MERDRERENNDDKPLDPYTALEKVIRLDKKHTNFEFEDRLLNLKIQVKYSQLPESLPGQHLLKQYWRHAQNYYFKSITQNELQRLQYVQTLFKTLPQCQQNFRAPLQFWRLIEQTVNPSYLRHYPRSEEQALDSQNWQCSLYLYYTLLEQGESNSKKNQKDLIKAINQAKLTQNKLPKDKTKHNKLIDVLKKEQRSLKSCLLNQKTKDNSQVTKQIMRKQKQLKQLNAENIAIFENMKSRVQRQVNHRQFTYCLNQSFQKSEGTEDQEMLDYPAINKEIISNLQEIDIKTKYLKYLILGLERKQVAESISKIKKVSKIRNETRYVVEYEKAMSIPQRILTEKQLNQLNHLRQYSLLKFYNTSLKSTYSFICQNFLGFREIFNNRNKPCKYKEMNMIQAMKQDKFTGKDPSIKGLQSFEICHHCKLLYPQNLLSECKYTSKKMGVPINPFPFFDSYVHQVVKNDQSNNPTRFTYRKRNPFNNYIKLDDEYICGRKFCKYCLRQNYEQGIDKNGLCPFCQGICFCTRCARNDMVSRLKSMFVLLGGDLRQINRESELERLLEVFQDQQAQTRKKGRPKKTAPRKSLSHTGKYFQKLQAINNSMSNCGKICDVVKRRQKTKIKLAQASSQAFLKKVSMICSDYQCNKKLISKQQTLNKAIIKESPVKQKQKSLKIQKKRKRPLSHSLQMKQVNKNSQSLQKKLKRMLGPEKLRGQILKSKY